MPEQPDTTTAVDDALSVEDEFYVGYSPEAPDGVARRVRLSVVALLLLAVLCGGLLAIGQRPFDVAFFEFGAPRTLVGTVVLQPYPMLRVERPGQDGDPTGSHYGSSHYYVVAFGKHGAAEALAPCDGQRVQREGSLSYRDDQTRLELVDGSVQTLPSEAGSETAEAPSENWGEVTLRGEIVDSKCYLGVMKPGHHKPHRACASLCIRGGIPPLFVPYGDDAANLEVALPTAHLLLVGPEGQALGTEILDWLAEPVEITGRVQRLDDLWMIAADPRNFRRALPE